MFYVGCGWFGLLLWSVVQAFLVGVDSAVGLSFTLVGCLIVFALWWFGWLWCLFWTLWGGWWVSWVYG